MCVRVARGLQDKEIASEMGLSEATVGSYLSRIFLKAQVRSRPALVTWLFARGWLRVDDSGCAQLNARISRG